MSYYEHDRLQQALPYGIPPQLHGSSGHHPPASPRQNLVGDDNSSQSYPAAGSNHHQAQQRPTTPTGRGYEYLEEYSTATGGANALAYYTPPTGPSMREIQPSIVFPPPSARAYPTPEAVTRPPAQPPQPHPPPFHPPLAPKPLEGNPSSTRVPPPPAQPPQPRLAPAHLPLAPKPLEGNPSPTRAPPPEQGQPLVPGATPSQRHEGADTSRATTGYSYGEDESSRMANPASIQDGHPPIASSPQPQPSTTSPTPPDPSASCISSPRGGDKRVTTGPEISPPVHDSEDEKPPPGYPTGPWPPPKAEESNGSECCRSCAISECCCSCTIS